MTALTDLPPELLDSIFSYLACNQQQIGHCRLVCRRFHHSSSPFYLATVVFAKRVKDVIKLLEVLDHPYFGKHVDTLVYDASCYVTGSDPSPDAFHINQYVRLCKVSNKVEIRDEVIQRRELGRWSRLSEYVDQEIRSQIDLKWDSDDNLPTGHRRDGVAHDAQWMGRTGDSSTFNSASDSSLNKSYARYTRLRRDELQMEHMRLPYHILREVFSRSHALRRIIFSDYRCLAREGESWDGFRRRLFGNVLEPQRLAHISAPWHELTDVCLALADAGSARIKELVIGSHAFEDPLEIVINQRIKCSPFMPIHTVLHMLPTRRHESMVNACKHLTHLRLPLCFGYRKRDPLRDFASTPILRMLDACQTTLTHLMLAVDELFGRYGENCVYYENSLPFDSILAPQHFKSLQCLDLRG